MDFVSHLLHKIALGRDLLLASMKRRTHYREQKLLFVRQTWKHGEPIFNNGCIPCSQYQALDIVHDSLLVWHLNASEPLIRLFIPHVLFLLWQVKCLLCKRSGMIHQQSKPLFTWTIFFKITENLFFWQIDNLSASCIFPIIEVKLL